MKMIIVGCGRMGSGLAQNLCAVGHQVTVVDRDPSAFQSLGASFCGQTVAGVGFDRDVLLRAKIEQADALAAVTSSDEANAVIARLGREFFHVPRVVARLYDPRKADIYRRLGQLTIAPTSWGIDRVADLLCYSPLDTVHTLGRGVELVAVEVPSLLVGRKARELTVPGEITVVALTRANQTCLPTLGTELQAGDLLHLVVVTASGDRLKALLGLS